MTAITRDTQAPTGLDATVWCDGSCPANPGPMGIGFHGLLFEHTTPDSENAIVTEQIAAGYRLGNGTNNRAEYLALIAAMRETLRRGVTHIQLHSDSLLCVNQINGVWAVSDNYLKPLREEAEGLSRMFTSFKLSHVDREGNVNADYLSKNPTEPTLPPFTTEIDISTPVRRKITRPQAAMIRWWWKTGRCRNEYRLARIFGGTPSHFGRIGRGEQYKDITVSDLPRLHNPGISKKEKPSAKISPPRLLVPA